MANAGISDVLRQLRRLVAPRPGADSTDAHLLRQFVTEGDEAAFEAILARHGPMVLGVCRGLLSDVNDAEDAFAATFLVLVQKAGSIGRGELVANWLYGVAHRVANRIRLTTSRRHARECEDAERLPSRPMAEAEVVDSRRALHEELNRLPAKYRSPLVLCYLQGKTQEEAARELGWSNGTVRGRLERGRQRLRFRLVRRGLALSAGAVGSLLSEEGLAAAVPLPLSRLTLRAAHVLAAGAPALSEFTSVSVCRLVEGVVRAMFMTKMKIALCVFLALGLLCTEQASLLIKGCMPGSQVSEKTSHRIFLP